MSEAKFTKGPWRFLDSGEGPYIMAGRSVIALVYLGDSGNPALLMAAPELYAALESLLEVVDFHGNHNEGCPSCSAYDQANAALAKARGEHV